MPKLTKRLIEALEPEKADYAIWDSEITGFAVKVTPKGKKAYILKYRNAEGRQRKATIGHHGQITCENARQIASEWFLKVSKGLDPVSDKRSLKTSPTVSELCDRYLDEHSRVYKKASSIELDEYFIRQYIKPSLGKNKAVSITKNDIERFFLSLKKTPSQANRILATLSKMFNLAEDWDLRKRNSNPCYGIKKFKEVKRERYLNEEEIERLFNGLNEAEKDGSESIYFTSLIRLLLLTGARLSEIKNSKWEWLNRESGTLRLPDSKTGAKTIYLSPQAMEVLDSIPRLDDNPHIIVGNVEGKPLNNAQKPWRRLREKLGLDDVRLHDLRHTFASLCVANNMSLHMVARLLGHSQTRTSERYAHLAHAPLNNAAMQVGEMITKRKEKQ